MNIIVPVELEFNIENGCTVSEVSDLYEQSFFAQKAIDEYYLGKISEDDLIAYLEYCGIDWEEIALIAEMNMLEKYGIKI